MKTLSHVQILYAACSFSVRSFCRIGTVSVRRPPSCVQILYQKHAFFALAAYRFCTPLKDLPGGMGISARFGLAALEGFRARRPIAKKRRAADRILSTPVHVCRDCRDSSRGLASTCRGTDVQRPLNVRCMGMLLASWQHATSIGLARHWGTGTVPVRYLYGTDSVKAETLFQLPPPAAGETTWPTGLPDRVEKIFPPFGSLAGQRIRRSSATVRTLCGQDAERMRSACVRGRLSCVGNACTVTSALPSAAAHVELDRDAELQRGMYRTPHACTRRTRSRLTRYTPSQNALHRTRRAWCGHRERGSLGRVAVGVGLTTRRAPLAPAIHRFPTSATQRICRGRALVEITLVTLRAALDLRFEHLLLPRHSAPKTLLNRESLAPWAEMSVSARTCGDAP